MDKDQYAILGRKAQEEMAEMEKSGFSKLIAKHDKGLHDAYCAAGFTEGQAFELLLVRLSQMGENNERMD